MAEIHHKVEMPAGCDIKGCSEPSERSVNVHIVEKAGLTVSETVEKRAHLCKHHYREVKKKTKKDREMESIGR